MSSSVEMPALGESVTEGTVTRWLKQVGDRVEVDEPLLEVSTDKVDTEIPSPVAGTLQKILVDEDETVEVGAQLAVIGDGDGGSDEGGESGGADQSSGDQPSGEQSPEQTQDTSQDESQDQTQDQKTQEQADQAEEPAQQAEAPSTDAEEPQKAEAVPSPEPSEQQDTSTGSDEQSGGDSSGGSSGGGTEVPMPALGESVTEGTVTRWLKAEGDTVEVDEPLLEVSTDKVDTEIPSPVAGTLQKILVGEDETVEVGAALALIGDGSGGGDGDGDGDSQQEAPAAEQQPQKDEQPEPEQQQKDEQPEPEQQQDQQPEQQEPDAEKAAADQPSADMGAEEPTASAEQTGQRAEQAPASGAKPSSGGEASYVTPLVRKLASEHSVDLAGLTGTGVGGRIRKQDVLAAAEQARATREAEEKAKAAPAEAPAPAAASSASGAPASRVTVAPQRGTTEKMSRLRKVIASRMVESLQVSAQLTTVVEVDVTKIARLRARAKASFEAREGVKLSFLPFFALATVEALKAHPKVNATLNDDEIVYPAQENLGVAVDSERGLLVPVIRDAGDLNIAGLARKIADLADRTRNNKITPDELGGGTFTLTNTGSRGALFDTPIINQPQVGILGTGAVVKRPVVASDSEGGETIAIRSMVYLALSYDHRLVDGSDAARFLVTIKDRLEEGAFEADLNL